MQAGVIAAGHFQTAQAGAEILKQGGNAVDAAVAATFASFISESALVNIGGSGIAQVYDPGTGQAVVYDFFSSMPGQAPNGTVPDTELDFREVLVDFGSVQQPFFIGRGSVAVPGAVAGLCAMVEERGSLPLSQILAPSVRMAREGVVLSEMQAYIAGLLTPILTDTPGIARIYAPDGQFAKQGDRLRFPRLANTLKQLGRQGASLFYTDSIAREILADQRAYAGLLTQTDLAAYHVLHNQPVAVPYRGFTILLPPPSSDGGVLIAFALKLLATQPLPNIPHQGFDHLRTLAEVMRLTNLARAEWETHADQATGLKSAAAILGDANIDKYRHKLSKLLAGHIIMSDPNFPKGPSNTTHVSVADTRGMIASITTSAGESAGFVVGGTGVTLNNMLGEIDLHPHGFHQLPPGQRLVTMMSPSLVLRQGRPILAVGSGGSNRLRSAILQVISNVIDFQIPLQEAVEAPRIHFEDNVVQLEGGISRLAAGQLEAAGYLVNRWPGRNMFFGGTHAVAFQHDADHQAAEWVAVGDARRDGAVAMV